MRTVAIVQARMGSTRLPGKIARPLCGKPLLLHLLQRLQRCQELDDIVVATSTATQDDQVLQLADQAGVAWYRGHEHDVLDRYVGAARQANADAVVRITADCPLIDPMVSDRVVQALQDAAAPCDYASNVLDRTYPRGLDTEALWRDTLQRVHRLAQSERSREHVTWYIYRERPELFILRSVTDTQRHDDLRWTVDTEQDFEVIRALYEKLGLAERHVAYVDLVAYVRQHPEISQLNHGVSQATV